MLANFLGYQKPVLRSPLPVHYRNTFAFLEILDEQKVTGERYLWAHLSEPIRSHMQFVTEIEFQQSRKPFINNMAA